jgi:dihydrofolate reductase
MAEPTPTTKLTLMAAISLDGFITRHDTPGSAFTSAEDKHYFHQTVLTFDCLVFGAENYRQSSRWMNEHLRPDQLKVVLTRNPAQFKAEQRPGDLEFVQADPSSVMKDLAARGYRNACLLGGGQIYGLFIASGSVDELWITLEPLLFGHGIKLAETELDFRGELISAEPLNASTLLLKYRPAP